jgi:hypothetical protein
LLDDGLTPPPTSADGELGDVDDKEEEEEEEEDEDEDEDEEIEVK